MRVLCTGATGFIGSHLTAFLTSRGDTVIALVHDEPLWDKWLSYALKDTIRVKGDVRDPRFLLRVLNQYNIDLVFHLAAQAIVKKAILEPTNTYDINVMGTVYLLEACRQLNVPAIIQSCYDEKTRVVTERGIKKYSEVNVGDQVLSLNPETLEIEGKTVEEVIVQAYSGKMVHFKSRRINLMVTPNHRMLIPFPNVRKSPKKLQIESAECTMKRSICSLPVGRWVGKDEDVVAFEGAEFHIDPLLYLIGIYIGDGFLNTTEIVKQNRTGLSRQEWLRRARDPAKRFTALGKVGDREETVCHGYGVFLDIPKNDPCRERVQNTLKELNISFHEYVGKAGEHVFFTSKLLTTVLKECGIGAKNKRIPSWVLRYSPRHLQHLFDGLIDSDGHRGRYQTIFDSSSKEILHGFVELCTKIGRNVSISWRACSSIIKGRTVEGGGYHCYISKSNRALRQKIAALVDYSGTVWCLKVADNHNMLVEREGRFAFSGNTDKVYGEQENATTDSPLIPMDPYSTSKIALDVIAQSYAKTYDNMRVIVTRPCNCYGLDDESRIVSNTIRSCFAGEPPVIYRNDLSRRQYIYVDDLVWALYCVSKGDVPPIVNIATPDLLTQEEVVHVILKSFPDLRPKYVDRTAIREIKSQSMVPTDFGWKPLHTFESGIQETVDRCKEYWMK